MVFSRTISEALYLPSSDERIKFCVDWTDVFITPDVFAGWVCSLDPHTSPNYILT